MVEKSNYEPLNLRIIGRKFLENERKWKNIFFIVYLDGHFANYGNRKFTKNMIV